MNVTNSVKAIAAGLLMGLSATAVQAEIQFSEAYNFRDYRVNTPLTYTQGTDQMIFGITIVDSETGDVPEGAIVRAKNLVTEQEVVLRRDGIEFYEFVPYTAETASGDWLIEVNSDVGSASAFVPAFGTGPGTGPMPYVGDFALESAGAQPHVFLGVAAGCAVAKRRQREPDSVSHPQFE